MRTTDGTRASAPLAANTLPLSQGRIIVDMSKKPKWEGRIYGRSPRNPLEAAAAQVHAQQPEPPRQIYLPIVYTAKHQRKTHPEATDQYARKLCVCGICKAKHHFNYQRFRRALRSEFPSTCDSVVLYHQIEAWEAWLCGFWPYRESGGNKPENMHEAAVNFDVWRWFSHVDERDRLRLVKLTRQEGCSPPHRKNVLRKILNFYGVPNAANCRDHASTENRPITPE